MDELTALYDAGGVEMGEQKLSRTLLAATVLPECKFARTIANPVLVTVKLSRAPMFTSAPTSALARWNGCGFLMAASFGVAAGEYAPFAFFGIASAMITVMLACAGSRMMRGHAAFPTRNV